MSVAYDFSGRTAVVTGGASGIGQGVVNALAAAGANVVVWDIKPPQGSHVTAYQIDITKPETIAEALSEVAAIDILVHSAGYAGAAAPLLAYDPAEWQRIIDINLTGTFNVLRLATPKLIAQPAGRVVLLASLAGKEGTPNAAAYSASKAGVIALTKAFAKELATTPVRINALAPAAVETELLAQFTPEHVATMVSKSPLGRLGTVDEVAAQVLWMCSDACTFSTGAVFDLSGGRATY